MKIKVYPIYYMADQKLDTFLKNLTPEQESKFYNSVKEKVYKLVKRYESKQNK